MNSFVKKSRVYSLYYNERDFTGQKTLKNSCKTLVSRKTIDNHALTVIECECCFGGVAHLGERLTGSQEVKGSIPFISTKKAPPFDRFTSVKGRCYFIQNGHIKIETLIYVHYLGKTVHFQSGFLSANLSAKAICYYFCTDFRSVFS